MGGISGISWKKFDKFLMFVGCVFVRQEGDHRIYKRAGLRRPIVIPQVSNIPAFIVRNNLRLLGMTPDQFLEYLKR